MTTKKKNYIICAPPYGKSAGVRALYVLAESLMKEGFSVFIFPCALYKDGFYYIDKITDEMRTNDIVIYPEIIMGNPLRFKNVVRYVLYYPGRHGGASTYHHSEQIITWDENYYPHVPVLTFPLTDIKLFYNDNSPKLHNCYFVYKGTFRDVPEIHNAIEITMDFPALREDLGKLLRSTDILYSYDDKTALLDEAVACGVNVKIITQDNIIDFKDNYHEYVALTKEQLANFIEITQKMDYQGEIEIFRVSCMRKLYCKCKILLARLRGHSRKVYKYTLRAGR